MRNQNGYSAYVPAQPFIDWIERRRDELVNDPALYRPSARHVKNGVPWLGLLANELGVSIRRLSDYRASRDSTGRPADRFNRKRIQDMLSHAGVRFDDIYPDPPAADVPLEPDGFCMTCGEDVTPVDGMCLWCGRRVTKLRLDLIMEAHRAVQCGGDVHVVVRMLYSRTAYSTVHHFAEMLRRAFERLDLATLEHAGRR